MFLVVVVVAFRDLVAYQCQFLAAVAYRGLRAGPFLQKLLVAGRLVKRLYVGVPPLVAVAP